MARARKSHESNEENTKTRDGLEPPYSSKVDGHRYVIYCSMRRDGDPYSRMLVLKFLSTYAARYFVIKLLRDDEYEWGKFMDRDWMIETKSGITIRAAGNQMRDIIDHDPTERELEWTDSQLIGSINKFRYGRHEAAADIRPGDGDDSGTDGDEDVSSEGPVDKPKRGRPKKEPKEPAFKEPKERPNLDGFVSAGDIAKQLKVEGREVRGVLRALQLEKPAHGWSWPKTEADKLIPQIKAGLKKK